MKIRSRTRSSFVLVVVLLSACSTDQIDPGQSGAHYEQRSERAIGGTGRFYMGREIADVLESEHGVVWSERPSRDVEELPSRLLQVLNLPQSAVIADIGAGTGFLTFRLARRVPSGRVLAVDVQEALLDTVRSRMVREGLRNIQPILGTPEDPKLPDGAVDLALIVASYHEFSHPREMLEHIYQGLKEGGRIVIVEYRGEDETIPATAIHRMSEEQIRQEVEASGFQWRETIDVLPQQHIVVFEKPVRETMIPEP